MKFLLHITLFLSSFWFISSLCEHKDLYLNQTAATSCNLHNPCWLLDPFIWIDNTIPTYNDSITLNAPPGTSLFFNSSLTLLTVLINDVSLSLRDVSSLTVETVLLVGPSANLILEDHSSLVSLQSTRVSEGGSLVLFGDSVFVQEGYGFYLESACYFAMHNDSYGYLTSAAFIYGTIHISSEVMFASSGSMYFRTVNAAFYNTPQILWVDFTDSQVYFYGGVTGSNATYLVASNISYWGYSRSEYSLSVVIVDLHSTLFIRNASYTITYPSIFGMLFISSSFVNINTNNNQLFTSPLFVTGSSTINVNSISISNFSVGLLGDNKEPTDIRFILGSLNITGPFHFLQNNIHFHFLVQQSVFIKSPAFGMNGELYFFGPFMYLEGNITIIGHLETTGNLLINSSYCTITNLNLHNSNGYNEFTVLESYVNSSIYFYNYTMNYANATFAGYIINAGKINASNYLSLAGYYEQLDNGELIVPHVDLRLISPWISVSVAILNGALKYSISPQKNLQNSNQGPLLTAWSHLSGNFSNFSSFGFVHHDSYLQYSANDVYLLFNTPHHPTVTDWTTWIILMAILLPVVIIGIIVGGCKYWRRSSYRPIRLSQRRTLRVNK